MEPAVQEQEILRSYLDRYIKPDQEWLELNGNVATYWQARLAQTTTVSSLPDGRVKWRVRTPIVENVGAADDAVRLCLAPNWYAVGWSFGYDAERRSVDALVSICAIPEWDTYLLRLSDKAKLSAWLADVIAESLADAVGGYPRSDIRSSREKFGEPTTPLTTTPRQSGGGRSGW